MGFQRGNGKLIYESAWVGSVGQFGDNVGHMKGSEKTSRGCTDDTGVEHVTCLESRDPDFVALSVGVRKALGLPRPPSLSVLSERRDPGEGRKEAPQPAWAEVGHKCKHGVWFSPHKIHLLCFIIKVFFPDRTSEGGRNREKRGGGGQPS